MPSSYSPNLRIELPSPGEQANTWGNTTNVNLGTLIESAITGATLITTLPATLTTKNGAADTSRNMALLVTASLAADSYIIAPALPKMYVVYNTTAGGHNVTIKADLGGGVYSTGVTIPNGQSRIVYYSSALSDFFAATTYDISVSGTAGTTPAASGLIKTGSFSTGSVSLTVAPATSSYLGGVKPDATKALSVASDGVLAVKVDGTTIQFDGSGNLKAITGGSGVTSIAGTSPINVSPATGAVTVSLATAGTAGTYGYPTSVSVDAYGRVTSISAGTAPVSGVTSVSVTAPIVNTGTSTAPNIGITAGTYLPIAGGTMTGPLVVSQSAQQGAVVAVGNNTNWIASSLGSDLTNTSFAALVMHNLTGAYRAILSSTAQGGGAYYPLSFAVNNALRAEIDTAGNFFPYTDNAYSCGKNGAKWTEIWATSGTINTSDENQKTDILPTDLGLDFINALNPVSYKWKVRLNEVTPIEGEGAGPHGQIVTPIAGVRTHYGLIAQQVKTVLGDKDFGGYIDDAATGEKGLRYTEFLGPMIKAIQELNAKVEAQAAEIAALKGV